MKLSITIFVVTAFNRVTNGHNWLHLVTFVKEKLTVCMYVCCLLNNIEIRANTLLYTIVQYIKTSVDSTMLKIKNEKK
jgi:hypothetical protein